MNAANFPQVMCMVALVVVLVGGPLVTALPWKDHPEPERIKPRPGSDEQFGEWVEEDRHAA